MRNNKPDKPLIIRRNIAIWLAVATAIFGAIACSHRDGPSGASNSASSNYAPDKRDASHPSEPVKIGGTVYTSLRDYVESRPDRCSTIAPPLVKRQEIQRSSDALEKSSPMPPGTGPVNIKVYFHVITNSEGQGYVSDCVIQQQIEVLNYAFANTPFKFELAGKDRTQNDDWFKMSYSEHASDAEKAAKAHLNQGDKSTLNIYSVGLLGQAFGWARWPWDLTEGVDGVVLGFQTLPGGAMLNFNKGYTAVHEVGHWLGLFHTFENGCDGQGDSVPDTPDEDGQGKYCPQIRNSCPSPGSDPVDNFMDFTWDDCMTNFTDGQSARMNDTYQQYRQ